MIIPAWVPLLEKMLAQSPPLPGALCRNHSDLFDSPGPGDDADDTRERLSFAVRVCWCCPALALCKSWFDSLPSNERPSGVVAGRLFVRASHPSLQRDGRRRCD